MDQDLESEITVKPGFAAPKTITDMKMYQDGTKFDLVINSLTKKLQENDSSKEDTQVNLAIAYLGLEMTNKALEILNNVTKSNNLCSLAYLLRGITYLWIGKDENALASWKDGLSQGGQYTHYSIMSNLINDINFRTHVYTLRFNIEKLFEIIESWEQYQTFVDNDLREAYKELGTNVAMAITHFSQILAVDPKNSSAFLGRGIGCCLTGQWIRAIDNINHAVLENCESMHMAHRFRSVAYAAIGKFTYAIGDITRVIGKFPKDKEARLLRARYQIKLGLFKQACTDIMSIPSDTLTSKDWCTLAECLYATGALKEALEALCRTDQHSPNALYISFLVLRDVGQYDLALKKICAAVDQLPSPFIQRKLADFLLEVGRPDHAIPIYEQFYQLCRGDISAIHSWAIALFETCNLKDAAKVIVPFAESAGPNGIPMMQEHERPELKLNGELTFNGTSLLGRNIMDKIWNDRCLILEVIKNIDNPITMLSPISIGPEKPTSSIDYENFVHPEFKPTPQEIQMVADADRLGARCVHRGMDVIQYNSRVVRALGFCVLLAAALMRDSSLPPNIDTDPSSDVESMISNASKWRGQGLFLIDFFACLLGLASPMTEIRANYDMMRPERMAEAIVRLFPGRELSEMWSAPTYYLIRGHRTSPRFDPAIPSAVAKVVRTLSETQNRIVMPYVDIKNATTVEQIYEATQKNIAVSSKWTIPECAGISENRREIYAPTIILQNLGVLGYNFAVKAPTSLPSYSLATDAINSLFRAVSESPTAITALSALISVIWVRHPLTAFSPELGHVLLHAFAISKLNVELAEFHFGFAEDFILHMIDPDTARLEKMVKQHIQNNQIAKSFSEESINYWTEPYPKVYRVLALLDVTNDA
ncbi:hypothetical protein TVAG_249240 [Trichomonas vaginalis G3]|uniref:TPR Domain containing protein n=1 Tax=Trichomonas vaginalis (strain ATCC PRA-98 / G3) TaxID=412133 RepID=A2DCC7_TRIV3|nr:suppressor of RPS4-RLD 1 family [Trichomonas vaginalis G3]EAY21864.1 hypothetical protein TVAG_249240 [Trichomonas vaginalis G3]KAI5487662.1 suppressor of RPS4-RLD 1 family [Trichomonas vaginalis G3]|eukprot:XP_001582850.1 hypothetical protein [Trichomonas vaginalis G3]